MTRKKWIIVSIIAGVLSAGIKLHGYVSKNTEKAEIVCSYSVSEDKWTADPENGNLFRHNEISGASLAIEERHIGVNYSDTGFYVQFMLDEMKKSYADCGMTCETGESFEKDGTEWFTLYAENDDGIKILQNTAAKGDGIYVVIYIAAEEVYEAGLPDFREVFDSFKFSE